MTYHHHFNSFRQPYKPRKTLCTLRRNIVSVLSQLVMDIIQNLQSSAMSSMWQNYLQSQAWLRDWALATPVVLVVQQFVHGIPAKSVHYLIDTPKKELYRQHKLQRSQTNANSRPPPSASPSMAATAGFLPSKIKKNNRIDRFVNNIWLQNDTEKHQEK